MISFKNSQPSTKTSLKSNTTSSLENNLDSQPSTSSGARMQKNIPEKIQSKFNTVHSSNSTQAKERQVESNFLSCEQCGKPFLDQTKLTDHILEEHDSDPFD